MFTPPRDKTVYFRFSFVDYIKYRVYFWQKERNEETRNLQEKDAENMKILMRTMNEEVKIFREENERQIEEKLKSLLTDEDYKFLMSHKKEDAIKKAVDDLPVLEIEELKM